MSHRPFTVAVVAHDSARDLERLLPTLAAHAPQAQVVVADSGSRDVSAEVAREHGAHVVGLPANPGFGAANDVAVAHAEHDVTVLLNPDTVLRDDALARLADRARGTRTLHAPRLLHPDGSIQDSAHPLPGTLRALVPAVVPHRLLPADLAAAHRAATTTTVGWAIAACLAADTGLLRHLGPFDPADHLFFEDLDLCLRARAASAPTLLHPDLAITHLGQTSTGPAFGGEPHELLARRRRAVVGARLGRRALALDDLAQGVTFALRAAVKRDGRRERAQLEALRAARRG